MPTGSNQILITDTSVFWTRNSGLPLLSHTSQQSSVYLVTIVHNIEVIIASFYTFMLKRCSCHLAIEVISNRFKRNPPRRGQPLYKGQLAPPQSVLSLEVLL